MLLLFGGKNSDIFFRDEVWKGIGYLIVLGTFLLVVPYMFINGYDDMTSSKISITCLWFFFVLVNAYYGGALTMFFVSEITLPFKTIRDVLQVFPSWNLVFLDGNDNYFKLPASQVFEITSLLYHLQK